MVIDSHRLLWWLERSPRLSSAALETLDGAASSGRRHYVAAVSFWEIYRKELDGVLRPRMTVRRWPGLLARLGWLEQVPMSASIWLASEELNWAHRDPADRLIAATALHYGVAVLTKDRHFHAEDSPAPAVW